VPLLPGADAVEEESAAAADAEAASMLEGPVAETSEGAEPLEADCVACASAAVELAELGSVGAAESDELAVDVCPAETAVSVDAALESVAVDC